MLKETTITEASGALSWLNFSVSNWLTQPIFHGFVDAAANQFSAIGSRFPPQASLGASTIERGSLLTALPIAIAGQASIGMTHRRPSHPI